MQISEKGVTGTNSPAGGGGDSIATPGWAVQLLYECWRRRRFLCKLALAGLGISTAIVFLVKQEYSSTVRLMPPDPQVLASSSLLSSIGGAGIANAGGLASTLLGTKTPGALFVDMLSGDTARNDIIDQFSLQRVYRQRYLEGARMELAKRTNVLEDKQSGIISITIRDTDRTRARDIANAYTHELDKLVLNLNNSSAHRERIFLEERLAQVKHDLDESTLAMGSYSSKNGILDAEAQGKAAFDVVGKVQTELLDAQSQLRQMETIYAPDNTRIVSMKARITALQQQMSRLSVENQQGAGAEKKLPSIRDLPMVARDYQNLYMQSKIQESLYETLSKEYELARVQEAMELPAVKILDPPSIPERPSFPSRLFIVTFGFVTSICFGISILAANAWWQVAGPHSALRALLEEIFTSMRQSKLLDQFSAWLKRQRNTGK